MAHECPECYHTCYCGGDIDDICFNLPEDVNKCTCCPPEGYEDDTYYIQDEEG